MPLLPTLLSLLPLVPADTGPVSADHTVGWVCVQTPSEPVAAIALTNPDAYSGERRSLRDDLSTTHLHAHLCMPIVTRRGQAELPPAMGVFERDTYPSSIDLETDAPEPTKVELQVIPVDVERVPFVIRLDPVHGQWHPIGRARADTFVVTTPPVFPLARGTVIPDEPSPGDLRGEVPARLAANLEASRRFVEPCRAMTTTGPHTLMPAVISADDGLVDLPADPAVSRPVVLPDGAPLVLCTDTARDPAMLAIALPIDPAHLDRGARWFLLPDAQAHLVPARGFERTRTMRERPFGGYSICRQPTWRTSLHENLYLGRHPEFREDKGWFRDGSADVTPIPEGTPVTALALAAGRALIQVTWPRHERTLFIRADTLTLPRDPGAPFTYPLQPGDTCAHPRGEWRRLLATTPALPADSASSQPDPWAHLARGTKVLLLCDDGLGVSGAGLESARCAPIYRGEHRSAATGATVRRVLVRYAGHDLLVPEPALDHESLGTFIHREHRPENWTFTPIERERPSGWRFGLGTHGAIGLASGVTADARLTELDAGWTFDGAFGVGADAVGGVIQLTAGARRPFAQLAPDLEAFAGLAGRVDVYVTGGGGLGLELAGKVGLRFSNDLAPVLLEIGVSGGYGERFDGHRGGWRAGVDIGLGVELVRF